MRILLLIICLFCFLGLATISSSGGNHVTKRQAQKIAKKVFIKETHGRITKYSIDIKEEDDDWVFFFQGEKEFARPGYHWIIRINKITGQAEFIAGE